MWLNRCTSAFDILGDLVVFLMLCVRAFLRSVVVFEEMTSICIDDVLSSSLGTY